MIDSPQPSIVQDLDKVFALFDTNTAQKEELFVDVLVKGWFKNVTYRVRLSTQNRLSIRRVLTGFWSRDVAEGVAISAGWKDSQHKVEQKVYFEIFFHPKFPALNRALELLSMPIDKAVKFSASLPEYMFIEAVIEMRKFGQGVGQLQFCQALADTADLLKNRLVKLDRDWYQVEYWFRTHLDLGVEDETTFSYRKEKIVTQKELEVSSKSLLLQLDADEEMSIRTRKYKVSHVLTEDEAAMVLKTLSMEIMQERKQVKDELRIVCLTPKGMELRSQVITQYFCYREPRKYQSITKLVLNCPEYSPYFNFFFEPRLMSDVFINMVTVKNDTTKQLVQALTFCKSKEQDYLIAEMAKSQSGITKIAKLINYLAQSSFDGSLSNDEKAILPVISHWIAKQQEAELLMLPEVGESDKGAYGVDEVMLATRECEKEFVMESYMPCLTIFSQLGDDVKDFIQFYVNEANAK